MLKILAQLNFPEGPSFDRNGNIWLVEKGAGNLIYISNHLSKRFYVGGAPNGIAIDNNNLVWFCDSKQNSIRTFNPITKTTTTVIDQIDGTALKMPNDLTFDKFGNLIFTCPGNSLDDDTGYICCLDAERKLTKIFEGLYYPNGLAFNKMQSHLYVAETGTHKIWKFEWIAMTLTNKELFVETGGPIGPDGIAFDEDENLYVAVYGSGKIKSWDNTGHELPPIITGGKNPTNCAIDPLGVRGIIITEAENGVLIQYPLTKKGII
jgi:gluconolactonase